MSWDSYITNLTASNKLLDAAIGDDSSIWAKTADFKINEKEIKALKNASCDAMYQSGVYLGGKKYVLLRYNFDNKEEPHLNLKSAKAEGEMPCNATVFQTEKAFVIGVGKNDTPGGTVNIEVCKIGSYLKKVGY